MGLGARGLASWYLWGRFFHFSLPHYSEWTATLFLSIAKPAPGSDTEATNSSTNRPTNASALTVEPRQEMGFMWFSKRKTSLNSLDALV